MNFQSITSFIAVFFSAFAIHNEECLLSFVIGAVFNTLSHAKIGAKTDATRFDTIIT